MSLTPDRAPAGRIVLTTEDYYDLPDDGLRYEILDGELEMSPSPSIDHQRVSRDLHRILQAHVEAHGLGEVFDAPCDVLLADTTIVVPDLVYVSLARAHIVTKRAVEGAPDLLVEILSPSSTRRDRHTKAALYARLGVPFYWIVDPQARTLEEYERGVAGYRPVGTHADAAIARTARFPTLPLDLARIWP
ncbi:MAG: Uma2 family endonuclease [bacterium]